MAKARVLPDWLYTRLFHLWHWYALKILKVPFVLSYTPPPDRGLLAITFSWTKDYVERVARNFNLEDNLNQAYTDLAAAHQRINELTDENKRLSNGNNGL